MSKIQKIFVPTKFEELSFLVVQQMLALKEAGLEEIVFLHVVDRDEVSFHRYEGFDEELAENLTRAAETRFADWEKQLDAHGIRSSHQVEIGQPSQEILKAAKAAGADLILAGRQHDSALDRVYLGGTSMNVVRQSHIPVMVCKPSEDDRQADDRITNPFQRVLLATDFSEASARAVEFLRKLNGAVEEVDVVHVLNERDLDGHDDGSVGEISAKAEKDLLKVQKDLSTDFDPIRTHLRSGKTSSEILLLRKECDATLILLGTTGKHGLKELWLGSASHRVAELSDVPVVLVPRPA